MVSRRYRENVGFAWRALCATTVAGLCGALFGISVERATYSPARSVVATVDGFQITELDMTGAEDRAVSDLQKRIYDLRLELLDRLIETRLIAAEATRRNATPAALLDEVQRAVVTNAEVSRYIADTREEYDGPKAETTRRVHDRLKNQKQAALRAAFVHELRTRSKIITHLDPPEPFRIAVDATGARSKGTERAPVTIVEFADFDCPYCRASEATLQRLLSRYHGLVRLLFMDFPSDTAHPMARRAHEATRCAADQSKDWEFQAEVMNPTNPSHRNDLDLIAASLGLNVPQFSQCLMTHKHAQDVQRNIDAAIAAAVSGTPEFFINGRLVRGAQQENAFVAIIEDELKRLRVLN
jgi:protein-disulfide isomerase